MNIIRVQWNVRVNFNTVQVIGTAPSINSFANKVIEQTLLSKAVEYINKAQNLAECIVLSEIPDELNDSSNNSISVSFSIMFKNPNKAKEYAKELDK